MYTDVPMVWNLDIGIGAAVGFGLLESEISAVLASHIGNNSIVSVITGHISNISTRHKYQYRALFQTLDAPHNARTRMGQPNSISSQSSHKNQKKNHKFKGQK